MRDAELRAMREKVKLKQHAIKETNLFHLLIDQELQNIKFSIADLDYRNDIAAKCIRALDSYDEPYVGMDFGFDPGRLVFRFESLGEMFEKAKFKPGTDDDPRFTVSNEPKKLKE